MTLNRLITFAAVGLVALVAMGLASCAQYAPQTPRQQYAAAAAAYESAVVFATELAKAGKLSRADAEKIEHGRVIAASALNSAYQALVANQPQTTLQWISAALMAINDMVLTEQRYRSTRASLPARAAPITI